MWQILIGQKDVENPFDAHRPRHKRATQKVDYNMLDCRITYMHSRGYLPDDECEAGKAFHAAYVLGGSIDPTMPKVDTSGHGDNGLGSQVDAKRFLSEVRTVLGATGFRLLEYIAGDTDTVSATERNADDALF